MSEAMYCPIRRQYCLCHTVGRRCDDFDDERAAPQGQEVEGAASPAQPAVAAPMRATSNGITK